MTLSQYNIIKNAMQNAIEHMEYLTALAAAESQLFTTKKAIEQLENALKTLAGVEE